MLKNYLTTAFRTLVRHPFYAGLNIFGLAVGLAGCLLILLFVTDQLSFDRFHARADAIYRLNWDYNWNGNEGIGQGTPPPLAATLDASLPEIETTTRVYPVGTQVVRREEQFFNESGIFGVDPNFFDVFSFDLLQGDPAAVLSEPNRVVLTEAAAAKYFGDAPAVGQSIHIGEDGVAFDRAYSSTFTVTGIVRNPPHNSHFQFNFLTSMASHPQVAFFDWSWVWMQVVTYAVVPDPTAIDGLELKIRELVAERAPQAFERIGFSFSDLMNSGGRWDFVFQPMTEIYLGGGITGNRLGPVTSSAYVYILSVIAVFILAIACINFMNLSTARSANRAKEVGVRKVLGSVRRDLMGQFLTESMLYSALAMLLAAGLASALLPAFNRLAGATLDESLLPLWLPAALVGLTLLVGLLAGSYPGLYLSAFQPIEVLKGRFGRGKKGRTFRNGLVVLQFAISIGLIAATLLVHGQMRLFREADMGFDRENVLVISNRNDRLGDQVDAFKERLMQDPRVLSAAQSTGVPLGSVTQLFSDYYKAEGRGDELLELTSYVVDDDFIGTLGIEVLEGRGFSEAFPSGATEVVLNESAVQLFGWEDPVGKEILYPGAGRFTVIGVIEDFNFATLHWPIMPFALFHKDSDMPWITNSYVSVRVRPEDIDQTLASVEAAWTAFAPDMPLDYAFLDETLDAAYRAEQRLGTTFQIFAGLAVVIACLGLLGLAAFTAEKRTKEIGVRKALGATVPSLLFLLAKDLTIWVLIANVIAWPAAWIGMSRWLDGFAYRIDIGVGAFIAAGAVTFLLALLTIGYQALKAARTNPVDSLRYE